MITRCASVTAWHQVVGKDFDDFVPFDGVDLDQPLETVIRGWPAADIEHAALGHAQLLFLVGGSQTSVSPYVRPRYALDGKGRIRRIGHVADEVSIRSVLAASDRGYNGWHSQRCLLIHESAPGYGGNGYVITNFSEFFQWLAPILADLLMPYAARGIGDVWNGVRYRQERELAWFWQESQGIANAQELREFVDLMPDRSPGHVAQRLAIPKSAAKELLRSLGYEKDTFSGLWQLSCRPKLEKQRRRWMKNEDKWYPPPR